MSNRQAEIANALGVIAPFTSDADVDAEIARRIAFIKDTLAASRTKVLVLGISGGVDSSAAGRLAQLAVEQLRAEKQEQDYRFIAIRLPHNVQHDEFDAQAALAFIGADEVQTIDIAPAVSGLAKQVGELGELTSARRDFVLGNTKARMRMLAQYTVANARNGLVIGTDHAAEAVMGFFTKFGDGACDLAPLSGLVKGQVRRIAERLGAPIAVFSKVPTADLEDERPGIPDEQVHGVSYDDIDAFLQGKPVSDSAYQTIVQTYDKTQHKRELPLVP
ncbi:ammonia-dependent NAD(+) synthetase [Pseudomonas sp. URMO17WK12:I2]|uniref:ammonia-dependent NAD(+) synthetase n=1 Tax=Pseudomonas sp. URMO17WK12:I2 TaxID=1261623 RepID=UPI000DAD4C19|nr:ammonia-dependent NAD(+) synthetase [Pseudomonas sp. URMO17WK12:I2]PZW41222.1 NAD+ synthase [Pseudomonas sp. URMO17WK12:I2]